MLKKTIPLVLALGAALSAAGSARAEQFQPVMDFDRGVAVGDILKKLRAAGSVAAESSFCEGRSTPEKPAVKTPSDPRAILWKVASRSGAISYILGTHHSSDPRVLNLAFKSRPFFDASRVMVTEMGMDSESQMGLYRRMTLPKGVKLPDLLEPGVYRETARLLARYGISAERAAEFKVWAAFNALSRPLDNGLVFLDQKLYAEAERRNLAVETLETGSEIADALDTLSARDQRELLLDAVCDFEENQRAHERFARYYLDQDLGGLLDLINRLAPQDTRHFDAFMNVLLYRRSEKMAQRLAPILEKGEAFVAVGGLHLPGSRGLLHNLRERGFAVEPVDMDDPRSAPRTPFWSPDSRPAERAGVLAPEISGDLPEFMDGAQAAKVWDIVKSLGQAPEGLAAPRVRFGSFNPLRSAWDWLNWQKNWLSRHPEVSPASLERHLAFYYHESGVLQIDPAVYRSYYSRDSLGQLRANAGSGNYALGHQMMHYVFETRNIPRERHHCLFIQAPAGGGAGLMDSLATRLEESGLGLRILMEKDWLEDERWPDPCSPEKSGAAEGR